MKALNVILGVLVLAAAMLASVVAGAAGLLMVASAGPLPAPVPQVQTVQIVRTVQVPPTVNVFELDGGAGVVVFRQVDGKLVSRYYRAQA
ncbi:hypothetical protein [Comamonas testosteroni]|uniref:hypothetical protein n=1 Tax=Comamonas testosteroni TaxID=285 RepID=UPI002E0DBD8B|nr:hypothetical protein U0024_26755 [Comamonas testosteroni]